MPLAGGLGGGLGRHGVQPAARPFGRVAAAPFVCMAEECNAIVPPGQGMHCPMHRGGPAQAFGMDPQQMLAAQQELAQAQAAPLPDDDDDDL